MSQPNSKILTIDSAIKEIETSLAALEAKLALDDKLSHKAQNLKTQQDIELYYINLDRMRLARALEQSEKKRKQLLLINQNVAKRLINIMENVRVILQQKEDIL